MKKKLKNKLNLALIGMIFISTTPLLATSVISCSGENNSNNSGEDLKGIDYYNNLHQENNFTPVIPDGILFTYDEATKTEKSVNQFHWVNQDRVNSPNTIGFLYDLVYNTKTKEIAASIVGVSKQYDGQCAYPAKLDNNVLVTGVYTKNGNETNNWFDVKETGFFYDSESITNELFNKNIDDLSDESYLGKFKKLPDNQTIIMDYSNSKIEVFNSFVSVSNNNDSSYLKLQDIIIKFPTNLTYCTCWDFSWKDARVSLDFSMCNKMNVIDINMHGLTSIILPPNIEKIDYLSFFFDEIPTNKIDVNIEGIEKVKFFKLLESGVQGNDSVDINSIFLHKTYDLNPNAFYYSYSFPTWITVNGGKII